MKYTAQVYIMIEGEIKKFGRPSLVKVISQQKAIRIKDNLPLVKREGKWVYIPK